MFLTMLKDESSEVRLSILKNLDDLNATVGIEVF
jgi:serine/threonine-protein phosphatase 2A regulatory subunit A